MISSKPVMSMTFGYRWNVSQASSITLKDTDLFYAAAIPQASVTTAVATMVSAFSSVRLRKIEVWGLSGENLQLTPTTLTNVGNFALGAERALTDFGNMSAASHVVWKPRKGDLLDLWYTEATGQQIAFLHAETGATTTGPNCVVRITMQVVLNDATAVSGTITTSNSNTVSGGRIYWRELRDGANLVILPENSSLISHYAP